MEHMLDHNGQAILEPLLPIFILLAYGVGLGLIAAVWQGVLRLLRGAPKRRPTNREGR